MTLRLIVGMSRSGTTSLVHALNMRGDVAAFGETAFWGLPLSRIQNGLTQKQLMDLADHYNRAHMTTLDTQLQTSIVSKNDLAQSMAESISRLPVGVNSGQVFLAIGETVADVYNKPYWVEKTPFHLMYVDEIIARFPDSRIVVCIRSPEAFLLSYKHLGDQKGEIVQKNLKSLYHPILASIVCLKNIKTAQRISKVYPDNILVLRLEDTRKEPTQTLGQVYAHLKLPASDIKEFPKTNSSFKSKNELTKELSAIDRFWLKFLVGQESEKLGYDITKSSANIGSVIISVFTLLIWPIKNIRIFSAYRISPLELLRRWLK